MIEGVLIHPLKRFPDERGAVLHMLRCDDPHFERFGEIYFSLINQGVVKGWHLHQSMTLNYAVPVGRIRLVLYDERTGSPTKGRVEEIIVGEDNYVLVRIPPGVWNATFGLAQGYSVIANCATEAHDPSEITRLSPRDPRIPYQWGEISPYSG